MEEIFLIIQNGEILTASEFSMGINIQAPEENLIFIGTPADACLKCIELEVDTTPLDNYILSIYSN